MSKPLEDLNAWMPRLIRVWRQTAGDILPGSPGDRLLPEESSRIVAALRGLSGGLKGDRKLVGVDYMSHPDLLGAYLLWFWPVSYLQARACLLEARVKPSGPALDLGSGPGPLAMALADHGFPRVTAAERSSLALEALKRLSRAGGGKVQALAWEAGTPLPTAPENGPGWSLVSAGHLLNELGLESADPVSERAGLLADAAGLLTPGGALMVLEPALLETARAHLAVRDRLIDWGLQVRWPCLMQDACPALAAGPQATCHSEFGWEAPALVAELGRRAGLKKEALKTSAMLMQRDPVPAWGPYCFRIVSERMLSKSGSRRYLGCGPKGRLSLSAPKDSQGLWLKPFLALSRGDVVEMINASPKEGGLAFQDGSFMKVVSQCKPLGVDGVAFHHNPGKGHAQGRREPRRDNYHGRKPAGKAPKAGART